MGSEDKIKRESGVGKAEKGLAGSEVRGSRSKGS